MRIMGLGILSDFCAEHADCRKWIANWISDVRHSQWKTTHDIKERYASASFLADNIVTFNVRGNEYRLEVRIALRTGIVLVRWMGTHAEYTKRKQT